MNEDKDMADARTVLAGYRASIDNIDAALIHMLAERFRCTKAVGVNLDALAVLRQQRVPRAERLDETAVAGRTGVGDDDVVVRTLLRARAGQSDLQCHCFLLKSSDVVDRVYG